MGDCDDVSGDNLDEFQGNFGESNRLQRLQALFIALPALLSRAISTLRPSCHVYVHVYDRSR